MKFSIDRQVENKLSFLNTLVEIVDNKLTIDVYRKPSSTKRLIPCDSHHDLKHKMVAYHSMAHFMVSLLLSQGKAQKEVERIVEIGELNRYKRSTIIPIIRKHQNKKALNNISTFYASIKPDEPVKRIRIRYFPRVTSLLKPLYRSHNFELVHRNDSSLKNALGSIKDIPPDLHKSGIYRIQCQIILVSQLGNYSLVSTSTSTQQI